MIIPLFVPRIARKIVPVDLRVRLRRNAVVRWMAVKLLRGTTHCPFPDSKFELYFDGYRNIGFGLGIAKYEWKERHLVREFLIKKQPKVVWDIGANIGIWSLFLTSVCSADAEIWCFEPDPVNVEYLRLNMTKNHIGNWTIRPLAVSDQEGNATFFSDPVCGATGSLENERDFIGKQYHARRGEFRVNLTTVDSEVSRGAQPPDFMKIDVEGHELAVLRGAVKTLREHRPVLVFESARDHSEIGSFLRKLDYQLLDLEGNPVESPLFNTMAVPREANLIF